MTYQLSPPKNAVNASVKISGSKSISNRLLILQAVSQQDFSITNLSNSDDTKLLTSFFDTCTELNEFNVQNAGTVARFLTAFLATQKGKWVLQCAEPMKKRPIKILVDALRKLGSEIVYLEKDGFLPLEIHGQRLEGRELEIDATVSSQYITALMMIGPVLPNGLTIHLKGEIASMPYLEITRNLMLSCGFNVVFSENSFIIQPEQHFIEGEQEIFNESDWSSAAFFYSIVAISRKAEITLSSLLKPEYSSQGDAQVAEVFQSLGVNSEFRNQTVQLLKTSQPVQSIAINFYDKPDMVPAVAVACAVLGVELECNGVENLVIKESNRLKALQNELAKVDVQFTEIHPSKWRLKGKINQNKITSVTFETYEDHRIAMCFACLGFIFDGVTIREPEVVSKSYPDFWEDMKQLGLNIEQFS